MIQARVASVVPGDVEALRGARGGQREQDETGDPAISLRMQRVSAGGILLYVICTTFASFDWIMSRDPHWFSTIYGALVIVGQGLVTLAFQIIILTWLARRKPMSDALTTTYLHDLANLMFGFTVLWAYKIGRAHV